jgi:hypothetical protein
MERYPSGSRGPSAKGLDCVSGARVRIPLSPPYFSSLTVTMESLPAR